MEELIKFEDNAFIAGNNPTILFIEGDGTGPDIMNASKRVIDSACRIAYSDKKRIEWKEIYAGEKAIKTSGTILPDETIAAIRKYRIALKGPLETPVGKGIRSLNVALRQELDLFACIRPVKYIQGVPSPLKVPKLDIVIFRENTEDVYAGIEWQQSSKEAGKIIEFLNSNFNTCLKKETAIGIKPISEYASKRLMRTAINYALKNSRKKITIMHKGNIMKYTEGAFMKWCYDVAKEEFFNITSTDENETGKIIINDRIADSMFQQLLLRPDEYDIIITTNLNGDYISDAAAAEVGGLGMAPGSNINFTDGYAVFEATHGTAPKYAGLDKVNPSSLILSSVLMLEAIGWTKAAQIIATALEKTIMQKKVTYDLARQIQGAHELKCSEFADEIIKNMGNEQFN